MRLLLDAASGARTERLAKATKGPLSRCVLRNGCWSDAIRCLLLHTGQSRHPTPQLLLCCVRASIIADVPMLLALVAAVLEERELRAGHVHPQDIVTMVPLS